MSDEAGDGEATAPDDADGEPRDGDARYTVAVKRSARRVSRGAGEWVNENGSRRTFESKRRAREWARVLSPPDRTVWVQDANPRDSAPVDGYVVGGRRARPRRRADPGEQEELATPTP